MNRIDGKVAVITGGTQGLGAAIAALFARAGASGIVIVGRGVAKGQAVAAAITPTPVMPAAAKVPHRAAATRPAPRSSATTAGKSTARRAVGSAAASRRAG